MSLKEYKKKRNFGETPEPEGKIKKSGKELKFVVQRHDASRLHFDLRLEMEGVLKSWAVPKGPSLNPKDRRLAVQTEDHPFEYLNFKGVIPEGNYGAGVMDIWDTGTYAHADEDVENDEEALLEGMEKGSLKIEFYGEKLKGKFTLVRKKGDEKTWFLIKQHDDFSTDEEYFADDLKPLKEAKGKSSAKAKATSKSVKKNSKPAKKNEDDEAVEPKNFDGFPMPSKAKKAPFPEVVEPMKARLVDEAFNDENWLFELKWDGFRALAYIRNGKAKLYSRSGNEFTKYEELNEALAEIKYDAVLDGEIVALDDKGRPSFQLLQNSERKSNIEVYFYAFDLLYFNGFDVTQAPLIERKELLEKIIPDSEVIKYSEHLLEKGKKYYGQAEKFKLEGIIGKKIDSKYKAGKRSGDWVKIKTQLMQEGIIIGYNAPKKSREYFGSLLLAANRNGKLSFIGKSGGGFTKKQLKEVYEMMQPLKQETQSADDVPKFYDEITWIKPELVAEVTFSEWTDDGTMRHPVFRGMRPDKKAEEVVIESAEETEEVVTNAGKKSSKKKSK